MPLVIDDATPVSGHELVALHGTAIESCAAALSGAAGRSLGYAPGRWLLFAWDAAQLESLSRQTAGLGVLFDVTGKYRALQVHGMPASRALHRAVDADAVLGGRACAALTLFDCPAVLARAADGFEIWVHASYAAHLAASLRG